MKSIKQYFRAIKADCESGCEQPPGPVTAPLNNEQVLRMHGNKLITRRRTSYLLTACAVLSVTPVARSMAEEASVFQAKQFIQQSGTRLTAILDGRGDPTEKRGQVQALIIETMDIYGIAQCAMGPFWKAASNNQRDEYVRLLPAVLLGKVVTAFGSYQGVRVRIDRGVQLDDSILVSTTLVRPDYELQVTWVIGAISGATKIVDIVAQGASLRIALRVDYTSYLAQHKNDIQTLIEKLRREAEVAV